MPQEQLWVPPDKENCGWREQDTRKKKNSSGAVLCSAPAPPAPAWLGKTQESGGIRARIQPGVPEHEGAAASGVWGVWGGAAGSAAAFWESLESGMWWQAGI